MIIYEAECPKCGETFNPSPSRPQQPLSGDFETMWGFTPDDLEHGQTQEGVDCGGRGELMGRWHD